MTFVSKTGSNNPLNTINGTYIKPTFADIDGDGDLDLVVGQQDDTLKYYKNTGNAIAPSYVEQTGTDNPFNTIPLIRFSAPTFADIDGDGDLDLVVGERYGTLKYYRNTGSAIAPSYEAQTGTTNPFTGIDIESNSTPTLADIDGDGDLDLVVGSSNGTLKYYKNTGTVTAPIYTKQTGTDNPFNTIDIGSFSAPTLADIDGDGDLDLIVGEVKGTLKYYKNTGSAIAPSYVEQTGTNNPFNAIDIGFYSTPTLANLDGDGDLDLVVSENSGNLNYFENTIAIKPLPVYTAQTGTNNPFNAIDIGSYSTPTFADIDGDGDLDLVVGERYGNLNYFKNTGSAIAPIYTEQTGTNNPFDAINIEFYTQPILADIDKDGDLDLIVGDNNGNLNYFKNTGSAIAPSYTAQTGTNNPFGAIIVNRYSTPTFADIDGDGDLDLVVGEKYGTLNYFKNTGSAIAPSYEAQTGRTNPFAALNIGSFVSPTFADIDGDGDLDLLVSEKDGTLNYFKNTGSAIAASYTKQTGTNNPFNGINVGNFSKPTFADIDGDGDLDLIVGENIGNINYYKNGIGNNQAATDITLSANTIIENINTTNRVLIGALTITDPDLTGNNNVLSLGGTDAAKFEIDGDKLYLKANEVVDFETKASYSLDVIATDGALVYSKALTVDVTDVNEVMINHIITGELNKINSLTGTAKADTITGGNLIDDISGRGGNDIINGGNGTDRLNGDDGNDILNGEDGNDILNGNADKDILNGGNGNDTLNGGTQDDLLNGDADNDILLGEDGDDTLNGGEGNDLLNGGEGNDILNGGAGDNRIFGNNGDDTFTINASTDLGVSQINGGAGIDTLDFTSSTVGVSIDLSSSSNPNVSLGLVLNVLNIENIKGGSGDDKIAGNAQNNLLFGGAGRDTFAFGSIINSTLAKIGVDTIQDFTAAEDKIQLSKSTFKVLNTVGILAAANFTTVTDDAAAATATGAIVYNSTNGNLFYNSNGATAGFGTTGGQFANLTPTATLTNSLFEVVA
jgi:FG-GAP-like repeat/RTX calcium-binding nonapeptide repeat (4 copies)